MSITIEILSGLGDKGPAAIVVEAQGKRLLLDAGGALHPGVPITWARGLNVDAVLISHDHIDHIGGVAELAEDVPLYCTPLVAKALPHGRTWHPLPERGSLEVEGITVTTGQAGHSLGGVWLHLAVAGGVFYSGDACIESSVFPFDTPPKAAVALLDASYGSYDQPQVSCVQTISEYLYQPLAFPVPETGRALEMALWLVEEAAIRGLTLAIDADIRANLAALLAMPETLRRPGIDAAIANVLARANDEHATLRLISDHNDRPDQWIDHHLLHTGYLTPERRAQLAVGEISWQRWNVHLRASHLVALADLLDATQVVPLFTQFSDNELNAWHRLLSDRLCTAQRFSTQSRLATFSCSGSFACPQSL
ncbi:MULTISPECIES: MBL fold metallo-hydrolase [unclassified Halomonas]|uniref:MBL fold metallo-hydrolase n=1 Tax=unclassified Halomonas TaxID=2609666 RepID=UPI0007D9436D|nr:MULTISPECIES: MBL fold metallo-hydrolase [unclassified Halomonas]MBT2786110.1 MBL fold metallo-hydrolase [Halomonas sp. ISL-106]MBT2797132.1 MBL fold metallo-hydrolase [Halomonas sp. ISL-104]OAL58513.1 MBL fold metallo-hydrolase [Halomonas sp. ALS9]